MSARAICCTLVGLNGIFLGMKRYIQHEYLRVSHFTGTEWQHPVHNHNHFELIFVHKGAGNHCISNMVVPFEGPTVFFLGPSDAHHFELHQPTTFTFLKFTNTYLGDSHWNQTLEHLLQASRQQRLIVPSSASEKTDQLIRLIVQEWKEDRNENSATIRYLLQGLLSMVQTFIPATVDNIPTKHQQKITALLDYIHNHILLVDQLQTEQLAAQFDLSKHYLGVYFKEQTGVTLRDYITRYKLHLIENKLLHSGLSLKEISHEFGFSDTSHFNKFFRKHHQMSPSAFRAKADTDKQ